MILAFQEGVELDPTTAYFDKNPVNQKDIRIEVKWLGNVLELIKIYYDNGAYYVDGEHYDFGKDDSDGKYYLTLRKELFNFIDKDQEIFTLKFSRYVSAELKVNIIYTEDAPPTWPASSTLTASNVTSNSVQLSWTPATDDIGVTAYKIYQNDVLVQTVAGDVTGCVITGLAAETEYTFRVEAGDSNNQWTTGGPSVRVTTLPQTNSPPTWPAGSTLTASNITSNSVQLSWTPATDDLGVTAYKIYQNDVLVQTVAGNVTGCEITGLAAETEYTFRVEAGDGNNQWTTDGPSLTVTTLPEIVPEIVSLGLKAPRYTLEGYLFMGDTVKIEMTSNQSGLTPEVTVHYKEWARKDTNEWDLTARVDKTLSLSLTETSPGSKKYTADFTLNEGICEVTALVGKLKPDDPSPYNVYMNYRVAGRIKLTVQPPAGLDSEQVKIYHELLKDSFVVAHKTNSWLSFTSETKDPAKPNEFMIEGVPGDDNFQAASYELKHYKEYLIYEDPGTVAVNDGLESVYQYTIDTFSHLKVRVVDDETGEPIEKALVRSPLLIYLNGTRDYNLSALTDNDGYAATSGAYFAQNLRRDQGLELIATHTLYESKTEVVAANSLTVGENIIVIRLKKVPAVTLEGTVTGSSGTPIEQVTVQVPLTAADGTDISITTSTDENGYYTLEVPKNADKVLFIKCFDRIEKPLALEEGVVNTVNVQLPLNARVKINVETKDIHGNTVQLGLNWRIVSIFDISAKNLSNNKKGSISDCNCTIEGVPGDEIEINVDGQEFGFGQATKIVKLDENNYAEVNVVLTQLAEQPKINVRFADLDGSSRLGQARYMFLFDENGRLLWWHITTAPGISYSVPPGRYSAAFSWQRTIISSYLEDWKNYPDCYVTEYFEVLDGEDYDLGTIRLRYPELDPYFKRNAGSSVTCSQQAAIPGSVVTLRVGYDYDNLKTIDGDKLDLVAYIPRDAKLVDGSVFHRSTRGNAGSVQPTINGNIITVDLKDSIQGAAGVLTYQVRLDSKVEFNSTSASAELHFTVGGNPVSENIGFVEIPCRFITLNAPPMIREADKSAPVTLSGLAPANQTVELYDGNLKIGETQSAPSGVWTMNVVLPDRGTPIYHRLTAISMVDGLPYTAEAVVLVGSKGTKIADLVMSQGWMSVNIKPQHNFIEFPFVITVIADSLVRISFEDNDKVNNVRIAGRDAIFENGAFQAHVPYTEPLITVEYDEETTQPEEILRHDFGRAPDYLQKADVEFTGGENAKDDIRYAFGSDGYLSEFLLPEVKISVRDGDKEGYGTVSMKAETVPFDPANAQNRIHLGNGMYGYDFSAELVNGKYVITGYLDRGLFPQQDFVAAGKQNGMRTMAVAAAGALGFVKNTIEVASDIDDLTDAFGDLSKSAKMAQLLNDYENIRPNLEPHLQEYYDNRISRMGKEILMDKTLGFVQDGVGTATNLVPLAGQVVCGIAGLISDKLLGDMFDNEFESDYNMLMTELHNLPGGQNWYDRVDQSSWPVYDPETGLYSIPRILKIKPHYVMDPSGFVYEAVEDNRISGVTATALFLPKEKANTPEEAKASTEWQFWDAEWYLQENPQTTGPDGRYAWDVPEGWWMVQFVKDGYLTAYSDALPVPPPHFDVNIPMVNLAKPAVDKVIWGNGGRYVDVYFTKYMDTRSLEATSAFRLTDADGNQLMDADGNPVTGTVSYPEGAQTGVDGSGKSGLLLTKVARFTPSVPLTVGASYTLTVNRAVVDYAGFSLTADYVETGTVPAAKALIAGISAADITVEPGQDITQDLANALTFTTLNPGEENLLDTRALFVSSNPNVVRITPDGKATSLAEGTAQITAKSVDDPTKTAAFTVTVAYPPSPVRVSNMVILGSDGLALTKLNLPQGGSYDLNPVISPADAADKRMIYHSDNPAVASVDANGRIRAISKGIAVITAKTVDKNIRQMIQVKVTEAAPPSGGGGSGGNATPTSGSTVITAQQLRDSLNSKQPFNLRFDGLQIVIDPQDLPSLAADGERIEIQTAVITDQNSLNSFFVRYPGKRGIMKAFKITMTRQNTDGRAETITRFNGDITLTFQLTPEELAGIDPSTLVVFKRAEDGSITEYTPVFDWEKYTLSISTAHLCEFYIMGEKGIPTHRLAGANRYATAVAISAQGWQTSDYVILASGENYPDALAGTVLAAVKSAPVLLTAKEAVSSETLAEIKRLKAQTVYLLGGPDVISPQVEKTLAEEYTVIRLAGSNRYETAVQIGEQVATIGQNKTSETTAAGSNVSVFDTVIVTTGSDYPDALSIGPFSGQYGLPILFTAKEELSASTEQALKQWQVQNVILVGGSSVITAHVENILRNEMKLNVTRLSGADRYLTGLEIAKHFASYSAAGGSAGDSAAYLYAGLATGDNYPDALAGGALAAKLKMPVLLAGKEKVSPEIKAYLQELNPEKLYVFGGRAVITEQVLTEINSKTR
ncbi:MAG TPA: hypothetical protein GXX46_06030 [Peptococcaceae bacterium]|nr:hypothetical protein [Peptococcaceae bacterium]